MSLRSEQCKKVCRILDDVLANRPTERDSLIVAVQKAFKVLETAEPEPHWIHCSERLPELDDEVLVTDDGGELRHCIFCTLGETWCGFVTYEEGMRIEATAWMPLPEPWKGEEN